MSPFRRRLINGNRRSGLNLFIDRLSFVHRSDPLEVLDWLKPMRGHTIQDTVRLRVGWRRAFRRRLMQSRQRPPAWEGTRCK
jgi:hypothetical protein